MSHTNTFLRAALLTLAALASLNVQAQSFGDIPESQRERLLPQIEAATGSTDTQQEAESNTSWQTGTYGPLLPEDQKKQLTPFGVELFTGGFRGLRADGLNPDYRILPGDQITLRLWGAVELERVLPVDAKGNIFIPSVGPVQVQGVSHNQLNNLVRSAIRNVYPDNVSVYTNLQGVQPVAVFVTGFVNQPGRYVGVPSDSILYLLDQASGIDEDLGSYRNIQLKRDGEIIANIDLYSFLLNGELSHPQLQDGDTLVVQRRGPAITVLGDVSKPLLFELEEGSALAGSELVSLAPLSPGVSHALIRGKRGTEPYAVYQPLENFSSASLANGDEVIFLADERSSNVVVQLEGAYLGRSYYVVPKGTSLLEVLNAIEVDPQETAYESVSLRRESVKEQQQRALEDSLRRLETTYLGASSDTAEESAIRVKEAELISQFVKEARKVEPNGRLVIANEGKLVDVRLQDGDIITLPQRTDSILISGEVYIPQSMVYVPGRSVSDYIEAAGGFSQHADDDHILIARQNGEVRDAGDIALRPGDQILVLPKVETKNLQIASTVSQILYQIAVATKVALDL
ncbi:polysaccharide biosynthesis/export family protein [Marinobacter vinifirmus]|uniref:Polysaccharide export protein n=1 Tax=Marinobacter vinifirmus TaxID=355591 RepID=A0A558B2X7_9GAMM|nr:polysaccharide biosynthesis/export family protein [Marinobacter vinifirmus]TVT30866.1 MAG: polysaccharide export protein [Marinobacter vinifirmus]